MALGATPDEPHRKTAGVLAAVIEELGYAADDVHRRILDLCHPWETALRTIDFHGNAGTRDFEAANPRYTEVRLARLGIACAEAEAGSGPPLPVGLVHGDLFKGGMRPPLDPVRLLAALRACRSGAADAEVCALVGPPSFPAGCLVAGDVASVHAGEHARLRLRAVLDVTAERVVIRALPPQVGASVICARLHDLSIRHPQRRDPRLPIADVYDESQMDRVEVAVRPLPGTSPQELADRLVEVWGIEVLRDCQYPRPLAQLLAEWAAQPDADAGLDRFESVLDESAPRS
jgi:DNA gyrase/topoisomerase IV subunit A